MAEKGTAANAERAARLIGEICDREKSSRSAVFRRLGITGLTPQKIMAGEGCTEPMLERIATEPMLERIATEHARVTRQAPAPAVKAGLTVAPREDEQDDGEDEEESEEPESDSEDDDGDAIEDDGDELAYDENEGDDRRRRVPARDLDNEPAPRRAPTRGVVESIVKTPARFGPTVPGKGAPLFTPERSELHRAADVIAALGGIDNAERVVDIVRALKGAA